MTHHEPSEPADAVQRLGLWDAVSIIVGIVVGTSIFKTPQLVFGNAGSAWAGLGLWALGGVLSLAGALCYAELATTYPRLGGEYVYLSRAFGRPLGFIFGWAQLAAILTGSIGVMGYAFADYAVPLFGLEEWGKSQSLHAWLAGGAIVVLAGMNLLGIVMGKAMQNVLTAAKVLGLGGILLAGFAWGTGKWSPQSTAHTTDIGFAMIFVLYAYGGWNDAAFVAAEVRHPRRNIPRALVLGTLGITGIYLLVNAAYLWGLGFEGVCASSEPAADVLESLPGAQAAQAANGMRVLVMISALGAMNGLILTGSRLFAALGAEHRLFSSLGRWDAERTVPFWSIVALAGVSVLLVVLVGTQAGRDTIDAVLGAVSLPVLPWEQYYGGFDTLVAGTAPVFWLFFLLTGLSLFALREKDRDLVRPFSVPFYPFTPFVFCLASVFMLDASLRYAGWLSLLGVLPVALGGPLYLLSRRMEAAAGEP